MEQLLYPHNSIFFFSSSSSSDNIPHQNHHVPTALNPYTSSLHAIKSNNTHRNANYCPTLWFVLSVVATCCIIKISLLGEPSNKGKRCPWMVLLGFYSTVTTWIGAQGLYNQCFSGWGCCSGKGGNTSRRNLWIISKLVNVITAAGVVRNRLVAHPR